MSGKNATRNSPQLIGVTKQWLPTQLARTTSQPVVNAPTSLTNLAQLSGITIVPITSMTQSLRNNAPTIPQRINIRPIQPQLIRQSAANNNIIVTNTANGSRQQIPVNNAPILPSIQLLNPRDLSSGQSRPKTYSQSSLGLHNKTTRDDCGPSQLNNVVGRFVEESTTCHNDISSAYTIDDINQLVQRSNAVSPSSEDQSADMSLIRLMEIFNNPALTITPVGSSSMRVNNDQATSNSSSQISEELLGTRNACIIPQPGSMNSRTHSSSKSKVRIPKSAANLQLLTNRSHTEHHNEIEGTPLNFGQPKTEVQEASSSLGDGQAALNWLSSLAVSRIQDGNNSVTLSWMPSKVSRGGDLNDQQQLEENQRTQTMSVQLLHQLASQAEESNNILNTDDLNLDEPIAFEPECLISIAKTDVRQLAKEAKCREVIYSVRVSPDDTQKRKHAPLQTSERRLWEPRVEQPGDQNNGLSAIEIEAVEEKEVFISDRHLMLERMLDIANAIGQRTRASIEPDDIFVNRSKRIMSTIDTTLERRKRKRFESICDRSTLQDIPEHDLSSDSDESELSEESVIDECANLFEMTVVPIQLPLNENTTDQKREHLSSVGLISIDDKTRLSLQQCEERLRSISALALEKVVEGVPEDIQRFANMISHSGGADIQLRTETDIKRNEMPFIEGLNRNTSRIKMNYMSALGLDKRSKRTTLYRVTKTKELSQVQAPKQQGPQQQPQQSRQPQQSQQPQPSQQPQQQRQEHHEQQLKQQEQPRHSQYTQQSNDLNSKPQQPTSSAINQRRAIAAKAKNLQQVVKDSNSQFSLGAADMIAKAVRLAQASCRGAMQAPNKDDYMKSLGLTAS